jgi:TrmH family RNA methyltransferase
MVADAPVRKAAVSQQVFESLAERQNPQGLGALIRIPQRCLADLSVGPETFMVVLEEPQDPGNVGTIVRTVDCAGGAGIILLGNAADPYDPQSVRASMGSLFAVPVVAGIGASDFVVWANQNGLRMVGTSAHAETCYRDTSYQRPLALLFGSEQKGLSETLQAAAHDVVQIPMRGRATSLNLASAVAVTAYEV